MANRSNFEIAFQLGAQMDPSVRRTFSSATEQLNDLGDSFKNTIKTGMKVAAGLGTAMMGAGAAVGGLVMKASSAADEINKFSQVSGMSTTTFQEWDHVMKNFGYSAEQASGDLAALGEKAMDAANGVGEGAELFEMLGVKVTDTSGKLKSQEQIFNETITALQGMENVTERNAIASALLSTAGEELVPVLNMTAKELKNMKSSANIISEDDLSKADKFRERWSKVKNTFSGIVTEIGIKAMPTVQKFLDYILGNMPAIQENVESAGEVMQAGFEKAQPVIEWLGETGIPTAIDVIAGMTGKAKNFYNFISNNWSIIKPLLLGIGGAILIVKSAMLTLAIVQTVTGFMTAFKIATVAAKLSMLGLNGAMLANPTTWLIAGVMALIAVGILLWKNWDKVKEFLIQAWENIKIVVGTVGEAIKGSFESAYYFVIGLFSGIGQWFEGIFNGIISAFKGGVNVLIGFANSAIDKMNGISVKIPDWVPKFGGQTFGLNIPNIPMLAQGGITTGPTLAMIGEGAEQEAVLPLSKLEALLNTEPSEFNTITNNKADNQKVQYVYSPTYNIEKGTNKSEIEQVSRQGYEDFKRWAERYEHEKNRKSF